MLIIEGLESAVSGWVPIEPDGRIAAVYSWDRIAISMEATDGLDQEEVEQVVSAIEAQMHEAHKDDPDAGPPAVIVRTADAVDLERIVKGESP